MTATRTLREVSERQTIGPLLKTPTNVSMFMYSASVWLLHRIHYDRAFAMEHENLPEVVVHGTLAADWFAQLLHEWGGRGSSVRRLTYQNRGFMLPNETVTCEGTVIRTSEEEGTSYVDCQVWIRRPDGQDAVTGTATVVLAPQHA